MVKERFGLRKVALVNYIVERRESMLIDIKKFWELIIFIFNKTKDVTY